MTRIFYIPTGEFLKYVGNVGTTSMGLWYNETNLDIIHMDPEEEINTIINFTKDNFILHDDWIVENKLNFPILKEELEIVYD